jgi:hypothetical protein
MTYDVLDGTANVFRFPVEMRARATIDLMRDIRPDVRRLLANAEAFGFEKPLATIREDADRETASHIEVHHPAGETPSARFAEELLEPLVRRAVTTARDAMQADRDTEVAQRRAAAAAVQGHADAEWLQQRADAAALRTVEMGLIAHIYAEQVEGAARAIRLAREGRAWTPRSAAAEDDEWLAMLDSRRKA